MGATLLWRGGDLEIGASDVSVNLIGNGVAYCFFGGTNWVGRVTAYIQFVCELSWPRCSGPGAPRDEALRAPSGSLTSAACAPSPFRRRS